MPYRFTPGVPADQYPPPQRPPLGPPRRGFDALGCSVIAIVAGVAAAFLILTWFGGEGGGNPEVAYLPNAQPRPIAARGELAGDERDTIQLFQQTSPSVVHINTSAVRPDRMSFNLLEAAGKPQLIRPWAWDQQDNAMRLSRLGVGASLTGRSFRAQRIATTILALDRESVQERCRNVAARFGDAEALERAASKIELVSINHR